MAKSQSLVYKKAAALYHIYMNIVIIFSITLIRCMESKQIITIKKINDV